MTDSQITTLKNGLRLVTLSLPQVESMTVMVGVGAGSRYETRAISGLSHFWEHMAFKGTPKRPTSLAISSAIDAVGGEFNAFTDKEFTGYWIRIGARHQELAFDILADMLTSSLLKTEEIEREKGVIIEEINMYEDTPMLQVSDVFGRLLYGDNAMGWSTAGEKATVKRIQRRDFLAYIDRLYFPENMTVVVAGKIDTGEVKKLAARYFGSLQKHGHKITKPIKITQAAARLKLAGKKTEQAHFYLGLPAYDLGDQRRWAEAMLATILGGNMSSRLFIKIRERRGLAYYVHCSPEFYTDSGFLAAAAGVRLEKIEEAIKVTLGEFSDLASKKVTDQELIKAKEFNKGRLILAMEDSRSVATRAATQLILEGKIRGVKETLAEIDKVSAEEVQVVAKDIFRPEKLNLAIIGPYQDEGKFVKILAGQ